MAKDYLPLPEEEFFEWQDNFGPIVQANLVKWGIPATETDAMAKAQADYLPAYAAANKGKKNVRSTEQIVSKNKTTGVYKKAIRAFVNKWISFNNAVSDNERSAMRLPIRDATRTPSTKPATIPSVVVVPMPGSNLKVTVRQAPDNKGVSKRGKPEDAAKFEIAAWIGANAPVDGDGCTMRKVYSKSPVMIKFSGSEAAKIATIFVRWIGHNNQEGDWSNGVEEVISK